MQDLSRGAGWMCALTRITSFLVCLA
jgi:hypothetical protein